MNNNWKSHTALFLANFLYGINYVVAKGIMPEYIQPEALVFLRIIPSAIMFWLISMFFKEEIKSKSDYRYLFLAGLFGVFLNQFLFIKGLSFSTPIDAAIITTSNPILVLVVAAIVLKERISAVKIIGIIIGTFGALMLVGGKGFSGLHAENIKGDSLLLLNSISFAIYMALVKPLMQKYSSITVLKWTFLTGAILYFPIGINAFISTNWNALPAYAVSALFYIVLITTVITYFLINFALRYLKSTTVSIYIYVQPVVTAVTAILVGSDKLTWLNITASVLVFTGVYLVSIVKK